jgi:hypothetical protein
MTRYRVIDTMDREHEHHLSDDTDRAVNDERVFILEVDDGE